MRKKSLIIAFFIVFNLLLISYNTSVQAAYEIEINDGFDYEILKCENDFEIGDVIANAQGFELDSHHFDQETTVNVNVTSNFLDLFIDFNISADGYSEIDTASILDGLNHNIYTLYPRTFLDTYYNTSDWNTTTLSVDPGYIFIPFINNATFSWEDRVNEVVDANNQTFLTDPEFALTQTNGSYTNTSLEFYYELYLNGTIQYNVTDNGQLFIMTVDHEHHYQFAFNKTDNSMLGFRLMGWLDGDSNGSKLKIEYDYHTELVGYTLPDLIFGREDGNGGGGPEPSGNNLPLILGLSIGIPLVLILTAVIIVITLKKKKQG